MQFGLLGAFITDSAGVWPVALALAAYALDLLFADPPELPHPVQAVGKLLHWLERRLRGPASEAPETGVKNPEALRRAGLLGVIACLLIVGLLVCGLTALPLIGWLFALYFAWAGLALGALRKAGAETLNLIENGTLADGRQAVSMLVSRDTSKMDRDELRRSLAESLAENFNDAFVAPFFWLILAGPVGLWLYKAASTMDSMWGYKTPQWLDFGRCAARLDDWLAWLPARLSVFFLCRAGRKTPETFACPPYSVIKRDAAHMESPNAGWPMAACAWIVGTRMGGPTPYHGQIIDKPTLGPRGAGDFHKSAKVHKSGSQDNVDWSAARLRTLLALIANAGSAALFFLCLAAWLLLLFV